MLARSGSGRPPSGGEWLHEVKWDGVRAILSRSAEKVALKSRSGRDVTATYPELVSAALEFPPGVILDGEIVSLTDEGVPSFERLQRRMNLRASARVAEAIESIPVTYVAFDQLHESSRSLLGIPLEERFARLRAVDLPQVYVPSDSFADPGPLWDFVVERGIEGVVSKRRNSLYRPGTRSPDWVKTVAFKSLRGIVGGFTPGEGARRRGFGALVLGLLVGEQLRWIGSVGSGFTDTQQQAIRQALDEMTVADSPFMWHPDLPSGTTWVAPALVAVVQYKEWTNAGRLRGPSFKGFTDQPASDATWHSEGPGAPGQ
jgi:bifunctional non-homologous end joining protein LigD